MSEIKYLHEKVYDEMKNKILNGYYSSNSILPREIDLMEQFQVSRQTIRKAMDKLKDDGLVRKIKGTGTFVNHLKPDYDYALSNMSSFTEIIKKQGGEPNSIVLTAKLVKATGALSNKLSVNQGDPLYYIERIRRSGDEILCFEITYVVASHCPQLDKYVSPNASLYNLYETKYKLELGDGLYRLEAINAPKEISKILNVKINSALLFMEAAISLKSGAPLYLVNAYYIGSKYIFSTILSR